MKHQDRVEIKIWKSSQHPFDDVVYLMNRSHRIDITTRWLENKLSWGRGGIAAIAYCGDLPVGLALLGAAPYVESEKPTDVLLSLDNFVVEEYRGRGIYKLLLEGLNEACEEEGFELALTYPNYRSRPGFIDAGWKALPAMQAYAHFPLGKSNGGLLSLIVKIWKNRGEEFEAGHESPLDPEILEQLSREEQQTDRLQFSQSLEALNYRFNSLRGSGYRTVQGNRVSAIVRVGRRGNISEVQFLVTFPRQISAKDWRELLGLVKAAFGPDMISRIESIKRDSFFQTLGSGFIKLRRVTTPFWKSFQGRESVREPVLSGIDLHRW